MATTIGLFLKILIETLANNDLLRLLILLTEVERMKHNWLFNLLRSSQFTHVSGPFLVRQLSYFLGGLRLSGFFSMLKTPPDQGVRWTHGSTGSAFNYSCIQIDLMHVLFYLTGLLLLIAIEFESLTSNYYTWEGQIWPSPPYNLYRSTVR